jgi:transposase InsO family protein
MIRRWKKHYPLTVAKCHNPLTGTEENRLMVDGKMVLRSSEIGFATKQAFEESKGAGSKKIRHRLKSVFSGVTHRNVQTSLKSLPEKQSVNPIFDNVAPLKPIRASSIQERHQIDLVDMSRYTEFYDGQEYRYILSVIDVFSRYIWLRPLRSKESTEVADALESIYQSEGPPKIIQCDNGREFHGTVTQLAEVLSCQIINSRPYYPQSQGKIESSHKSWKSKIKYDLLKTIDSN